MDQPTQSAQPVKTVPVTVSQPVHVRWSWTTIVIITGMPVLLVLVAWMTFILQDPVKWCSVRVTDSKLATSTITDCTSIVLQLIHWIGMGMMASLLCVAFAFMVVVTRDLKAGVAVQAGMFKMQTGGDGDAVTTAARQVADAAEQQADQISGENQ